MGKQAKLDGRRIVITGAARGIGAAVAREAAAQGARVALVGIEPARLREVADAIGERATWCEADVADPEATRRAIDTVADRLGGLDGVFCNAGIASTAPLRTMDPAQLRRVLEVNVLGVFHTIRAALPHLVTSRGYLLVNASLAAAAAPPLFGAYGPSKAAAESMGDVLRQEVRHLGIDVGVCYLGFIDTDMVGAIDVSPGFQLVRSRLPPPIRGTTPLPVAVDAIVRGLARRSTRIVVPRSLRALLPLRWVMALTTPAVMAPIMPEVERLSAETDARFGGVSPTTEDPAALRTPRA